MPGKVDSHQDTILNHSHASKLNLDGKYLTSDEYHRSVGYDINVLHSGVLLLFALNSASNDV